MRPARAPARGGATPTPSGGSGLAQAALYVKPGGRLVYVTCSVLAEENEERIAAFVAAQPEFAVEPPAEVARAAGLPALAAHVDAKGLGIRLSPLRTHTDGFFIASLVRSAPAA